MKRIAAAALVVCLMGGTSALAQADDHHNDKAAGAPRGAGPTHGGPAAQGPPGGAAHPGGPRGPGGNAGAFHTQGGPAGVVHPQGNQNTFQTQGGPNGLQRQDRGFQRNGGPAGVVHPQGNQNTFQTQGGPNGLQRQDRGFHRNGGQPQGVVGQPDARGDQRSFNGAAGRGDRSGNRNDFRPSFGAPGFRPGGQRPRYSQQYFPRTFNIGQRYQWRGGEWRQPRGYYYRPWFYGQVLPFGWFSAQYYINDYYDYDLPVPPYGYEWIRNGPDALLVDIGNGEVVSSVPNAFY